MTRQDEWEKQEAQTAEMFAPEPVSEPTGIRKLNTRSRGNYNGYTASQVVKLCQKKKKYVHSKAEEDAMAAYFDERLANMGESTSTGTPDWLQFGGIPGHADIEPLMACGSIECCPDKWPARVLADSTSVKEGKA